MKDLNSIDTPLPLRSFAALCGPLRPRFMRPDHVCLVLLFFILPSLALATDSTSVSPLTIAVNYWRPLWFGGSTKVREWQFVGDDFDLQRDLGLRKMEAVEISFGFDIAEDHRLNVLFGRQFFEGHQVLTKDMYYNGTQLAAQSVASVDASRYVRVMILDYITLHRGTADHFQLVCGVSLDAIRFSVDAPTTATTFRKETFEQFDKQIVPVPVVGLSWTRTVGASSELSFEVRGGTWPGLNTWYEEEGTIRIWQYNLEGTVGMTRHWGDISATIGCDVRMISIQGESREDTNEITLIGVGPEITISMGI